MNTISTSNPTGHVTPSSGVHALDEQSAHFEYFCEDCISCVREADAFCHMCGASRPQDGWTPLQESSDRWLGERIAGKYDVLSWIASGSMSRVYRVRKLNGSSDLVLKISRLDEDQTRLRDVELRPWPYREADAQSALTNPHIVHILDVMDLAEGCVGLVMEHVDGVTLEEYVEREGPLSTHTALDLLEQAADGIHEAHCDGIIHRDIKPANLMIESLPDGEEFVRILDFGIACPSGRQPDATEFIGTPAFASPEQIRNGELSAASDIYSLGAVLFFMLTGRPPFARETTGKVLEAHLSDNPPSPSRVTDGTIPPEVERLVRQMLSKQPLARPRSVPALLREIESIRAYLNLTDDDSAPTQSALEERSEADTMEVEIEPPSDSPGEA